MKLKHLLNISIYILLFNFSQGFPQNLVRNWSFEDTLTCPTNASQINNARNWFATKLVGGSSDLFSVCNNYSTYLPMIVGVPYNWHGYQYPILGNNYAGIYFFWKNNIFDREYIETKLFRVLDPTVNYYVEFWVSLSNESNYAIENIGAYFSKDTLHYSSNLTTLIDAQVEHSGGIISDTMNWVKVSGYFKPPTDGYQFLTIGNFNVSDSTNKIFVGWNSAEGAYYYIDNVAVIDSALQHTIGINNEELKIKNEVIKIYPNPASTDLTLEFSSFLNQNIEIQIYNVLGERVLSENKFCQKSVVLDVSKLSSGIYFIRVSDESGKIYSEKLIIE